MEAIIDQDPGADLDADIRLLPDDKMGGFLLLLGQEMIAEVNRLEDVGEVLVDPGLGAGKNRGFAGTHNYQAE